MSARNQNGSGIDELTFAGESPCDGAGTCTKSAPWKILIVDDEEDVHRVTRMVLSGYRYLSRPLSLLHAECAEKALQLMQLHPDIALILLDVIMETDNAGLDLVEKIRHSQCNSDVRILVRTGQPGMFNQYQVARKYDINGFHDKSTLTADMLFGSITRLLREYAYLQELRVQQREMAQKIDQLKNVANLLQKTPLATMMLDHRYRIVSINAAFVEVTGFHPESVLNQQIDLLRPERCDDLFLKAAWDNLMESGAWEGELECATRSRGDIQVRLSAVVLRRPGSETFEIAVQFTDITEVKAQEREFLKLATRDPLTSLPNRNLFFERLDHAITQTERQAGGFALLFIDLDYFKNVNDELGHKYGDKLLKQVGQRLQQCLRRSDTVARIGGDEFTAIVADSCDRNHLQIVAGKINRTLARPYNLDGKTARIAGSIGIALYPEHSREGEDLLHKADLAMYKTKRKGRGGYSFYAPEQPDDITADR
jgi:diguanylate cyclase (GGDEF)-like protein/PAS domain S-box-containing protein